MVVNKNPLIYFLVVILSPLLGLSLNLLFFKKNSLAGSRIAAFGTLIGFINALLAWFIDLPVAEKRESWGFLANETAWLMAALILFVSGIVHFFSLNYMRGDRNYRRYFLFLGLVTLSTLLMVASDNIVILILFWSLSNFTLVLLMIHKFEWNAAKNSGILALKTFGLGLLFLSAGAGLLAYESGSMSLQTIVESGTILPSSIKSTAIFFIILAAFTQSGCWPFHGWLMSSLNSPTPVSAFMHAGLVNGGGLLITRFAPLLYRESFLLDILFILAVINLILGGIWKLLQTDIKRMLACSTMTQMGFMMMQCGLGLFPAALAHLCWHGLFKAFLFLKSGSTIAEHRHFNEERLSSVPLFLLSSLCGLAGAVGFIAGSNFSLTLADTSIVLVFFSWIASTQAAHPLLEKRKSLFSFFAVNVFCLAIGAIYGFTVEIIESIVAPLQIWQPQKLNLIHILGITLIFCIWIGLNLKPLSNYEGSRWWRRCYVAMLNASQPNRKTVTSGRNGYKF